MKNMRALLVLVLCTALGLGLAWAMLQSPAPAVQLPVLVEARIAESGVSHPVTAVLLNFRAYDTLLEVAVLLLALLGVLAGTSVERRRPSGWQPGLPILRAFARLLTPLMVLVAGYLLWAGSHAPGGAFQAGAVLAAAGVLLHLARLLPAWSTPQRALRWSLAGGFLVFLGIAALPVLGAGGVLLEYPPAAAGALILLVEAALAASLGLLLGGLFLLLSDDGMEFET
jgi:multisubunit Na+/H+ antiporter MnhB subunit